MSSVELLGVTPVKPRSRWAAFFGRGAPAVSTASAMSKLDSLPVDPMVSTIRSVQIRKGSAFSLGLGGLYSYLGGLNDFLTWQASSLSERRSLAYEAQKIAQQVDTKLKAIQADTALSTLYIAPIDPIRAFIQEHAIEIEEVYISGAWLNGGNFSLGQLTNTKLSILNFANNLTDVAAQKQLILQKLMQATNQGLLLMNSLQTLTADVGKGITQGIR